MTERPVKRLVDQARGHSDALGQRGGGGGGGGVRRWHLDPF